ncbi:MAG: protein-export chaperone SecB [Candidatus Zixiibacteriota bacterium]
MPKAKKQSALRRSAEEVTITPTQYGEILKCVDLRDIYLKEIKSTLYSRELTGRASLKFDESANVLSVAENVATIEVSYNLKAKCGRNRLFTSRIKYAVLFDCKGDIPDGFFELYNKHSLPLQTFPYLRECVNSMISRMGLPPLILPLRKFLVGD